MANRLVCLCNFVDEREIISALKKGASSTADIQKYTLAGTSCGKCLPEIDAMVKEFLKNKPEQGQLQIEFD